MLANSTVEKRLDSAARERAAWIVLGVVWLGVYAAGFLFASGVPNAEEVRNGNLATGLIDGLAGPIGCYQYGPSAGTLVFGALAAAPYRLTGSHALWIKLLGAFLIGGGVFFWTKLLRRVWGFQAAVLFLAMMTLPTPLFARNSHTFFANHAETIFFSGLLYLLAFPAGGAPPSWRRTTALGLTAGFGTFFCYQNFTASVAAGLLLPWRWGRDGLARLAVFAALAAGSAYALMGFALPLVFLAPGASFPFRSVVKWAALLAEKLFWFNVQPAHWSIVGNLDGRLSPIYVGAALIGLLWGAARALRRPTEASGRRPPGSLALALAVQAVVWLAGAAVSDFEFCDRYVLSLYPVAVAGIAYLATLFRARYGWLVVAPYLFAGALAYAHALPDGAAEVRQNARALWDRRGDEYMEVVRQIASTAVDDDEAVVAKLPRRWRDYAWVALGAWSPPARWANVVRNGTWTAHERRLFASGQGAQLQPIVKSYLFNLPDEMRQAADRLKEIAAVAGSLDQNAAASFVAGIGYAATTALDSDPSRWPTNPMPDLGPFARLTPQLSAPEFDAAFVRGAAARLGEWEVPAPAPMVDAGVAYWAAALGAARGPELEAAFRAGLNDGFATVVVDQFYRFKYIYRPADLPLLRDALRAWGFALRPAGDDSDYFVVEEVDRN